MPRTQSVNDPAGGRKGAGANKIRANKINKSVALKSGVVQDGIFDAEVAGVPVSTAFLELAVGDVQLEKKHLSPASKPFFAYSGRSLCIW